MRSQVNISGWPLMVLSLVFGFGFYQLFQIFTPSSKSFVTVKGVAEQEIKADYGVWNIYIDLFGASMPVIQAQKEQAMKEIQHFLIEQGFSEKDFTLVGININPSYDRYAFRGNLNYKIVTNKVDLIEAASQKANSLYEKNVYLNMNSWGKQYYFIDVQKIKPELVKEALRSAQKAGENFAQLSNLKLGKIKKADQGVVRILSYDRTESSESVVKIARLVSTIDYFLENP